MIRDMIAKVDPERLRHDLFYLSKDPLPFRKVNYTRHGQQRSTLEETDDFIEQQLAAVEYSVHKTPYQVRPFRCDSTKPLHHWYAQPAEDDPWFTACNLETQRLGAERPDEIIVLVSHKDSMSWIGSPGAHDNCAGTVANMEIARVLGGYEPRRTIRVLFCNEEHTPWTSKFAADAAAERGDNIVAVLNQDSLDGKSDEDMARGAAKHAVAHSTPEGEVLAQRLQRANTQYDIGLDLAVVLKERVNDDDGMFIKAGFRHTVMNVGSLPYADSQYHLEGDVPERVNIDNLRRSTQLVLAAVLELDQQASCL